MKNKKKLSVVIPTFNREKVVLNAVRSVLNQNLSYWNFEVIISDDGSSDKTFLLFKNIKNPKVKYFFNKKNKGVNAARNSGIKKARGDYILFLDSDDVLTKDGFDVLESYDKEQKLEEVNFFGTEEIRSGKKMFSLAKEQKYSYKDWLEGEKIKGEFISFVKAEIMKKNLFNEKLFCFEQYHWNKLIKKYGVFASSKVIRQYSFAEKNRVSKELINPKHGLKRYIDYQKYIKEFGKDYIKFGLKKKLGDFMFRAGFYAIIGNKIEQGRKLIKNSLNYKLSIIAFSVLVISYLGHKIFIKIFAIVKKLRQD